MMRMVMEVEKKEERKWRKGGRKFWEEEERGWGEEMKRNGEKREDVWSLCGIGQS